MKTKKTIKEIAGRIGVIVLLLLTIAGKAQMNADDIIGRYVVPSKDGAIEVFKNAGKYYGKIILNKNPDKLDVNNPEKDKQTQKVLGLTILKGFTFNGDDVWQDGTIYDPKNGKTYSCKITRLANGDLNIRGFIGISMLGRTETFTKIKG